jgi:hypothetical protein
MNRSSGQFRDEKIWEEGDGWAKLTGEMYWNDTATARSKASMRYSTAPQVILLHMHFVELTDEL